MKNIRHPALEQDAKGSEEFLESKRRFLLNRIIKRLDDPHQKR